MRAKSSGKPQTVPSSVVGLRPHPTALPELHPGKQGVKRGTLLKVSHDGTALNSQLFLLTSSHREWVVQLWQL